MLLDFENNDVTDTADKIDQAIKKMREELDWQLGGVSDKVYYEIKDKVSNPLDTSVFRISNSIEQQVKEQIEKGEFDPKIMAKVKDELIRQITQQTIKEHEKEIQEIVLTQTNLIVKIINSIMSRLRNLE